MISIRHIHAKQTWPIRHTVMYPEQELNDIKLPDDLAGQHFGLFEYDELISVVSLFPDGDTARFRKFATLEKKQRSGYGGKLLQFLIDYSKSLGIKKIWCNARKSASEFYAKFGFHETGQTYTDNGHDYVIIELDLSENLKSGS